MTLSNSHIFLMAILFAGVDIQRISNLMGVCGCESVGVDAGFIFYLLVTRGYSKF
jgi:hypothetical protein